MARARPAGGLPEAPGRGGTCWARTTSKRLDEEAVAAVDAAVEFADKSPFPDLASLYDDIYVIGEQVRDPWYSTDSRSPDTHRGEQEREAGDVARELAEAGAAHEDDTDDEQREARARGEGG